MQSNCFQKINLAYSLKYWVLALHHPVPLSCSYSPAHQSSHNFLPGNSFTVPLHNPPLHLFPLPPPPSMRRVYKYKYKTVTAQILFQYKQILVGFPTPLYVGSRKQIMAVNKIAKQKQKKIIYISYIRHNDFRASSFVLCPSVPIRGPPPPRFWNGLAQRALVKY